ncbi:YgaP family membrane protein [Falsibacillus albus]|uniref:DUF2892 domain-containing protein n=1 Tax=Falsibacillus albus TaxID=2478915 RepID=A0A3L7JQ58_9BACI|nr:DUF2892 domain-containing protein [Falsibacillus albus]RLQ90672.1 DUF2892 domain-containing protein [Falsibacillus albus]
MKISPNIGIINALVRITLGLTVLTFSTAKLTRRPWKNSYLLLALLGAMKVGEGILRYCPLTAMMDGGGKMASSMGSFMGMGKNKQEHSHEDSHQQQSTHQEYQQGSANVSPEVKAAMNSFKNELGDDFSHQNQKKESKNSGSQDVKNMMKTFENKQGGNRSENGNNNPDLEAAVEFFENKVDQATSSNHQKQNQSNQQNHH